MARPGSSIRLWLGVVIVLAGLSWQTATAAAYQRTKTCNSYGSYQCKPGQEPKPIAWPVRCVRYRINDEGSSDFRSSDQISSALRGYVRGAFRRWNAPSCSDFEMVEGALTSNAAAAYKKEADWDENMNLVVWRDQEWPYDSLVAAFALTSVTYNSKTGRIADADIELNSDTYEFARLEDSQVGATEAVDISNTLVHEVGHFLGLGHTQVEAATMYRSASAGEVKKRTLHQDDIDGLCAIYPGDERSGSCEEPADFQPPPLQTRERREGRSGGCSVGGREAPPWEGAVGVWVVLVVVGARSSAIGHRRV